MDATFSVEMNSKNLAKHIYVSNRPNDGVVLGIRNKYSYQVIPTTTHVVRGYP